MKLSAAYLLIVASLVAATASLTGCAIHDSPDYERHRNSRLTEPYDRKDVIYFDTYINTSYPGDDPDAEALRMEWLEAWLAQRKMCANGYKILKRREFDMFENNPARYDIRYEVSCKTSKAEDG